MTEQTELRIPYDDLKYISFECRGCGTEITPDLSREERLNADGENKGLRLYVLHINLPRFTITSPTSNPTFSTDSAAVNLSGTLTIMLLWAL